MKDQENLYFIAIVLPGDLSNLVRAVQQDFSDRFQSHKSLQVVPHITLKAPFRLPADAHHQVLGWFRDLCVQVPPFGLHLQDFGTFNNPKHPVIFIKPELNDPLAALQKNIIQDFYRAFDGLKINAAELDFKPHITIAYRDLLPDNFQKAWEEFKDRRFEKTFSVHSYHLLKRDETAWQVIRQNDLKS